jgi:hypothetical protein
VHWILARVSLVVILSTALAWSFIAPVARAQGGAARARTLFAEGVQLSEEGLFEQAEARFREALTLRDAPAIRYNLASVLYEQNEYPEASALVDSVLGDGETTADMRQHAQDLRGQIDSHAGYARIDVEGGGTATIDVDGYPLESVSAEIPLAPGSHVATATRDGESAGTARFDVAAGQHRVIPLDAREAEAAIPPPVTVAPEAVTPEPERDTAPGGGGDDGVWIGLGIGIGAAVIAGVVVAVVFATQPAGVEAPVPGNFEPGILTW